jgi:hypothetical protein
LEFEPSLDCIVSSRPGLHSKNLYQKRKQRQKKGRKEGRKQGGREGGREEEKKRN